LGAAPPIAWPMVQMRRPRSCLTWSPAPRLVPAAPLLPTRRATRNRRGAWRAGALALEEATLILDVDPPRLCRPAMLSAPAYLW